ncbi:MAG: terpene cyclase/mutase family protein [Defluviitaleaceae bacterium]|nr:terpene cyclase/mutase family protein [Defluviitaleaceae bacterium]
MRKLFAMMLAIALVIPTISVNAAPPSQPDWEVAMHRGMSFIHENVQPHPLFGFVGGEWAVLALARGGYDVREGYFEDYIAHIAARLDALVISTDPNQVDAWAPNPGYGINQVRGTAVLNPATGRYEVRLMNQQTTENSRQILALAALGVDVTNFTSPHTGRTFDLVSRLGNRHSETDSRMWGELQGTNGPVWALIALNTHGWETPFEITDRNWVGGTTRGNAVTHDERITWILDRELYAGGWDLGGMDRDALPDPDITAMTIQSLAPYVYRPEVSEAIDRALDWLSATQLNNGGWGAWGADNVQSAAQVVVALTALGYDPMTDQRFVKPGGNPVTTMLRFFDEETGGFYHPLPSPNNPGEISGMATEQATYALIAYWRFVNEMTPLYDMSDVFEEGLDS